MSRATYLVGDVFERMAELPDGSVDLVMTSPPFLALRSYLPDGHPDKAKEIGSEATPAEFIDTLLALTAEWRRLLAPHGSICVELGDSYSGSGGAGGDYGDQGLRAGQAKFDGSGRRNRPADVAAGILAPTKRPGPNGRDAISGWPMDKSLCGIPDAYELSLAYGYNVLDRHAADSPAGRWRIRNKIAWVRPNPPVGALADKFRPATSYLTCATIARDRYFDLDAVRGEVGPENHRETTASNRRKAEAADDRQAVRFTHRSAMSGAPPLDWWEIPPGGYSGTTTSTRRERVPAERALACGAERTTSPDCPVHAGLPGQLPKALRDARVAEQSPHTRRNGDGHAQEQLAGFAPTDGSHDRSDSSPAPTSEPTGPGCSPAATTRSTAFRRTGPSPATTRAGTPSGETSLRTDDTSESPSSDERHLDTSESSTSVAGSVGSQDNRTAAGTADNDNEPADGGACTCSWYRTITQTTSHYAVYPTELCERPIEAMCPRRVCTTCGQPSRRITVDRSAFDLQPELAAHIKAQRQSLGITSAEVNGWLGYKRIAENWERTDKHGAAIPNPDDWPVLAERLNLDRERFDDLVLGERRWAKSTTGHVPHGTNGQKSAAHTEGPSYTHRATSVRSDLGWSDCEHGTWRAGHVLDPFGGSGTTAIVATGRGRDCTLIDIDERNAELARERLGMFLDIDDPAAEGVA